MDRNTLREELVAAGREMDRLNAELWDSDGLERWLAHVLSAHSVLITAPINMIDDARRIVVQQKRDDDTTYGPIRLLLIRSYLTALHIYFEGGLRVRPRSYHGSTELSDQQPDGRPAQERKGVAVQAFPILGEAATAVEPGDASMIATLLVAVIALFVSVCFGAALEPCGGLGGLNRH